MTNIALTGWKLQLPVNSEGKPEGGSYEIPASTNYPPWYRLYENNLQFRCPKVGASTSVGTSPRCEMGQMKSHLWRMGQLTMHATLRECSGKTHIHQIFHPGEGSLNGPVIRVMHDISVKQFYYLSRTPEGVDRRTDFGFCPGIGESFMLHSKLYGTAYSLTVNFGLKSETKTEAISPGWGGMGYSFKVGVYRGPAYMHIHDLTWSCQP
jgi:hypothetical protein